MVGTDRFGGIPRLFRENPMLLTLSMIMFTNMFGFGMIIPVIPLYGRTFDVSTTMIGLLVTSFGVARLLSNYPAGRLADRVGRRKLLLFGPLVSASGAMLAFLAPDYWLLVGALSIQGIGSATYATAAMTTLADISTEENRGRMMSIHQGSLLLGASFGPSLGGLIGGTFGLRAVFLAAVIMYLAVATIALIRVTETLRRDGETGGRRGRAAPSAGSLALLANVSFLAVAFVSMTVFFSRTGGRSTMIPLRGAEDLLLDPLMIGALLTVGSVLNVIALPFAGWGIDRFGRKNMIVPSLCVSGIATFLLATVGTVPAFFGAMALLGIGTGIAGPAPAAYAADLARGQNYGATLGLFRTMSDFGFVLGPILLGWFADLRSFSFALYVNAALLFTAAIVFALLATEVRRSSHAREETETETGSRSIHDAEYPGRQRERSQGNERE
jgi:MFS transporter, DHA1 family, multidrug resistance protein